ncbi:MAG: hypothetical protein OXF02_07675, partial [Simkaniaceae bacterium]|nr:hypothetical protein [Simkaniaceae bacterium]
IRFLDRRWNDIGNRRRADSLIAHGRGTGGCYVIDQGRRVSPLRVEVPPAKKCKVYSEQERSDVVDCVVKMRKVRRVEDCVKDCDLSGPTVLKRIKDECKTCPEVANTNPGVYSKQIVALWRAFGGSP